MNRVAEILANPGLWRWDPKSLGEIGGQVASAKRRDQAAVEFLEQRYAYWLAKRVLAYQPAGMDADLDELYSEARLALIEAVDTFAPGRGNFTFWLGIMVMRRLTTAVKKIYGSNTLKMAALAGQIDPPDDPRTPLEELLAKEREEELREAWGQLPETERALLGLVYWDELTLVDAAKVSDLSLDYVVKLHRKALKTLREELS